MRIRFLEHTQTPGLAEIQNHTLVGTTGVFGLARGSICIADRLNPDLLLLLMNFPSEGTYPW